MHMVSKEQLNQKHLLLICLYLGLQNLCPCLEAGRNAIIETNAEQRKGMISFTNHA